MAKKEMKKSYNKFLKQTGFNTIDLLMIDTLPNVTWINEFRFASRRP